MRCEYNDGLKVDYAGHLRITRGSDVNVFMKEGTIRDPIKEELEKAAKTYSCGDLRKIAEEVMATVGTKACIHE